jgi:2-iminobutanoate/2-iminopropanoate deaminase
MRQAIQTDKAPKPVGPYSQAIRTGGLLFVSGQGALDPATGQPKRDSVEVESRQVMENLKTILEAAGSSLDRVVKSTCYLTDLADFQAFNKVYGEYFQADPPARTTIQAARLPLDFRVEVDVIATVD